MPLTTNVERELIHTRTLEMTAHRRSDGWYDIEGHLIDRKPYRYVMPDHAFEANAPVHDMWLRLTVDRSATVREVDALMDVGPHFTCSGVVGNYQALIGLSFGKGWNRGVRERLGGSAGCTHLSEMLAQMATTGLQALWAEDEIAAEEAGRRLPLDPAILNSCHTYDESSEFVKVYFPESYTTP
tara:strand:+ start:304 stop:855 length:552 start_codon:yes stop_codon:yes gene_type:complete